MIRFAHPEYFVWFIALAVLALFYWFVWVKKQKQMKTIGDLKTVRKLVPERSRIRYVVRAVLVILAVGCLLLALAGPQVGTRYEEVKRSGIDLIVAVDVSASMLARDISPNRLEAARQQLRRLIERLQGDRIGIVVFSGEAYTQLPLTTDYGAAAMLAEIIDVESAPTPGTAVGKAIDLAVRSFSKSEGKNRAMILITDGENHEDDPLASAENAAENGVVIHTIGMGSPEGVPIPVGTNEFKTDRDGNIVLTRLNEDILRDIAARTGGTYRRATNLQDDIAAVFSELEKLEKKEFAVKQFTSYEHRYQYPLAAAIILLLVEVLM
ncbi:MAG: VWA domain-containing protein, partial [Bacteroidota bacterium]|nr:VWA domain-containing protein [Bacteroidota bacterium]